MIKMFPFILFRET